MYQTNITIIISKAMAPVLDSAGRHVQNADGTPAYTGCPPCIALKIKQMPSLEALAVRSGGRVSVVEIDQPALSSPANPDTPAAILALKTGWFPCIMATPTKDWNASLQDKNAPMALEIYNGRREGAKWMGQSKPLTAALIYQWAETLSRTLVPKNPNADDELPMGGVDKTGAPRMVPRRAGSSVAKRLTKSGPKQTHYSLTDNRKLPRRPL